MQEEALFYGGGEVEELNKKKKNNDLGSSSSSPRGIVCLGYRAMNEQEQQQEEEDDRNDGSNDIRRDHQLISSTTSGMRVEVGSDLGKESNNDVVMAANPAAAVGGGVVTQIDYVNYFIPFLAEITACPYYWGKIDRYEAEALLENKPEGSFLLRDSAQDEFVFSVSFRSVADQINLPEFSIT